MTKTITELPLRSALSGAELIEFSQLSTTIKRAATTINAAAADNSFNDSGNGFLTAGFGVGDRVGVKGFTNGVNNLLMGVVTVLTAGKMTIGGTDGDAIINEAAGNAVEIAKWTSRRATAQDLAGLVTAGIGEAPADGNRYVRKDTAWSLAAIQADAPADGSPYVRKDNAWAAASSGGVSEAPISLTYYARRNGAWAAFTPFTDAPSDGSEYVRKNGAWSISSGGGGGGGGGSGPAVTAPTVVQFAGRVESAGAAGSITLPGAPTAGNLLIAIGGDWLGTARTDNTGWNRHPVSQSTQSNDTGFIYWKVAGSGESATQTVFTNANQYEMFMWEIAGSDPAHFVNAVVKFSQASGTALSLSAGIPTDACLALGVFQNQQGATNPSLTMGAGPVVDATVVDATVGTGGPRQIVGFHEAKSKGVWNATATLGSARTNGFGFIVLAGTPTTGSGNANQLFDWTDNNPPVARRYWQIEILASDGGTAGQPYTLAELYMRDAAGNLLAGTWSANSSAYGAVSALTDGNATTYWGGSSQPTVLTFDAGAGNTVLPDKIEMTARQGFQSQAPGKFNLKSSPDNVTYTSITAYDKISDWTTGQRRIFTVRPYMVQLVFDQFGTVGNDPAPASTTIAELELLGLGADLTLPASTSDDIAGSIFGTGAPANAFNGNLADYALAANVVPLRLEYRFAAQPTALSAVAITARNGYGFQAPGGFKVLYSRDGISYRQVYQSNYQQTAFGNAGERRVFSLLEVTERTPDVYRRFMATAANSPVAAWAKVPIDYDDLVTADQIHDMQGAWDTTNSRYTPKKPGYYQVNCRVKTATAGELRVAIAKNGARHASVGCEATSILATGGSLIVYCNGSTDYIEVYAYTDTARAYVTTSGGNPMDTYLEVVGPL